MKRQFWLIGIVLLAVLSAWWIMEDGDTYLEDAATGKKYLFKSAEGIELKKEVYMPDSGTMDYVLVFEPLPSETQTIHFLNPTDPEGNIYDKIGRASCRERV